MITARARSGRTQHGLMRLAVTALAASLLIAMSFSVAAPPPAAADSAPPVAGEPETVTADRLPTVQINGVVWDQVIVGDRVYVTGQFTQARPAGAAPGQNQTARSNVLAYNLATGALITSWAPSLNAQGLSIAASEDGSRIYVAGDFSSVSGVARSRVVALNAQTGAVISSFSSSANSRVSAVSVRGNTLYLGGNFSNVGGSARSRLAAVNASTGSLLPWAPSADRDVVSMTVHPASGRVIVGGSFTTMNGQAQRGMTSLDGTTGAVMPWAANQVIQNYGPNTQISSLTTDGESVFGVAWAYFGAGGTTANFEGQFAADPLTGELKWVNGCRGDQYGVAVAGNVVYTAGHTHDCGMINYNPEQTPRVEQRAMAFDKRGSSVGRYNAFGPVFDWAPFAGRPSTDALYWWPQFSAGTVTGSYQAGWTVESNGEYVVYGGEFPRVNGVNQQGLVRFAMRTVAPNVQGPQGMAQVTPTLTVTAAGVVRVAWTAPYDLDNRRLRYEVLRGATVQASTVIARFEADSNQWTRTPMGFLDETAPPGTNQTYRVRVLDPFGNGGVSGATSVSVPSGTRPTSAYSTLVRQDGATNFWRMDEATGTLARDWVASNDLTLAGDVVRGASGALVDEPDSAVDFPGSTNTNAVRGTTSFWQDGPQRFSVEAWFRTTSTQGGKIVGFGSSRTGRSSSNLTDRHIYLTNSGEVHFGLRPDYGPRRTIHSSAGLNDGQWHHVVATLDNSGARLYVDGDQVSHEATITKAQVYYGYWRVGGDRLTQWPDAPTREAFEGSIDEVAIYQSALTAGQVAEHFETSGRTGEPNQLPVAAFTTDIDELDVSFDGSSSSDPDGSVVAYSWDFDDGSPTVTAVTPQHRFPAAGTYDVALTVTDNRGGTNSVTQPVTVAAPENRAPTAAFTATTDDLTVSMDGSDSSDPDGHAVTYSWDFAGEATANGVLASHTFATPGTKQVTLTVTDPDGLSDSLTRNVVVSAPEPGVTRFGADAFERTTSNGFGTADTGGPWTLSGAATSFSVSSGAGRIQAAAGQTRAGYLTGAESRDFDVLVDLSLNQPATGSGAYASVIGRRVSSGNDHRAKVRYQPNGSVAVYLGRTVAGTETTLAWTTVPGVTASPGDVLRVRLRGTGTTSTTAQAKVWPLGSAEPQGWLLTNTSATPGPLQAPGHLGMMLYLSSSWTGAATTLAMDNLDARVPE